MRLNETTAHSWDVRVAFDEDAAVDETTARLVVDHYADGLGFLLGFTGRADEVEEPALVGLADLDHDLEVTDAVRLVPAGTASLNGPADAVARLFSGRLAPGRTPQGVGVTGNVTLDQLRRMFPGY